MGCGVLFPRNYECKSDSEEELEQQGGVDQVILILTKLLSNLSINMGGGGILNSSDLLKPSKYLNV